MQFDKIKGHAHSRGDNFIKLWNICWYVYKNLNQNANLALTDLLYKEIQCIFKLIEFLNAYIFMLLS